MKSQARVTLIVSPEPLPRGLHGDDCPALGPQGPSSFDMKDKNQKEGLAWAVRRGPNLCHRSPKSCCPPWQKKD